MTYATIRHGPRRWAIIASFCALLACAREPSPVPPAGEARTPNPPPRTRGTVTPPARDVGMPGSPAFLAAGDTQLLVGDRGGNLLWWDWPKHNGPLIKAHDDGGPVAATTWFATSGGWDPTVKRWQAGADQPRYTVRPFDGRVTALCIQGDDLLVAGVNKVAAQGDATNKDRPAVSAGTVVRIDPQGKVTPFALTAAGQIDHLVCGADWVLAVDQATPSALLVGRAGKQRQVPLTSGPATAAASRGSDAVVADRAGIWVVDPANATLVPLARHGDTRVLSLVALGEHLFGATSEGVVRWPGGDRITHDGKQPAALARHGQRLFILWEDGAIEQRSVDGKLIHGEAVPRTP